MTTGSVVTKNTPIDILKEDKVLSTKKKQLTKREMQYLVEAYAKKHYAMLLRARETTITRLVDRFCKKLDRIEEKYPHLDLENNQAFKEDLNRKADEWWRSRMMKGPGVDW